VARGELGGAGLQLWSENLPIDDAHSFDLDVTPRRSERLASHVASNAHKLARAAMMRTLPRGELDEGGWTLSWSKVLPSTGSGAQLERLPTAGAMLRDGDRVTVQLHTSERPLYLSALLIHCDAKIELLSSAQAAGIEVQPGSEGYSLGQRCGAAIRGHELRRPARSRIRSTEPLPATIFAVLSDVEIDLRSWSQAPVENYGLGEPLEHDRRDREVVTETPVAMLARYRTERFDFLIC
jgi:hypothetical protein